MLQFAGVLETAFFLGGVTMLPGIRDEGASIVPTPYLGVGAEVLHLGAGRFRVWGLGV